MNIIEFTHTFLPHLIRSYSNNEADLHTLVDIDVWKRVFPDALIPEADSNAFRWYQIRLNAFELKDGTLLLTYTLPTPLAKGEPKFAGIRLKRDNHEAHYFLLQKPQSIEDAWDIVWMPFPKAAEKMKLQFKSKIDGTDSLRNFVLTIQHYNFNDSDYEGSILSSFIRIIKNTVIPME